MKWASWTYDGYQVRTVLLSKSRGLDAKERDVGERKRERLTGLNNWCEAKSASEIRLRTKIELMEAFFFLLFFFLAFVFFLSFFKNKFSKNL